MAYSDPSKLIDALGGTVAVARICDVSSQAVSKWRRDGIPKARLMYLQAVRPNLVASDSDTSSRSCPRPLRTYSQGAENGASQTSAAASTADLAPIAASIGGAAETMATTTDSGVV